MWNEEKNIPHILSQCTKLTLTLSKVEIIIINNGSKDNSKDIFNSYVGKLNVERVKIIDKLENTGYGAGLKVGFKEASGEWIGWTHGDLQTDIMDNVNAIKEIENISFNSDLIVKGHRKQRSFTDRFISNCLTRINQIVNNVLIFDINGQPNWIKRDALNLIHNLPNDSTFELYVLTSLIKQNFQLTRIEVSFPKRKHGHGANESLIQKSAFIIKSIRTIWNARLANVDN